MNPGLKKQVRPLIVEDKPFITSTPTPTFAYTPLDDAIQSHPGYFAPKPTASRPSGVKRPKPPASHSSRKKKSIREWLAVPSESYTEPASAAPRRVNKYTQRKREEEESRKREGMVGGRRVNKYTQRKRGEEGRLGEAQV